MSEHVIAYDPVLRRPACVLIAAAMGASSRVAMRFPSETWLVSPTPDMRVFRATDEQLDFLLKLAGTTTPAAVTSAATGLADPRKASRE